MSKLSEHGHEVKCIGLQNKGEQHFFPFSILPARNLTECMGMIQNLHNQWKFDVLMVALDLPIQQNILRSMQNKPFKYVGIMPVEADPVSFQFAATMMQMDKPFIISEFGAEEAKKAGVDNAEHLVLGADTMFWKRPTDNERKRLREALGFDDETFVVFTNADNQERKNYDACFRAFSKFKAGVKTENVRYIILTRWNNLVGYDLEELSMRYGIMPNIVRMDRGMTPEDLWATYAASDAFMILSKADGYCFPIIEAMSVGIPCIGTDCTAIQDHLKDGRGYLVEHEYIHVDPFGLGHRYWANPNVAAEALKFLYDMKQLGNYGVGVEQTIKKAREYVEERTWDNCVNQIERYLETIDEQKVQEAVTS